MTTFQRKIWQLLTFRGRPIIEAMITTLCAGDEFVLSNIRMKHVILRTEKNISELPFFFFLAFKAVLYLIEYAVPPIAWKFGRFSHLPLARRIAYLEKWEGSSFFAKRNLFKLVKAVCISQIFSEHKLLTAIGYGEGLRQRMMRGRRKVLA